MSGSSRINILPDLLVRKIAAGEVVERPASVVKELVENAVDAGAGRIAITIEEGGKRLIRVTDDGCGMTAEDLRLAVTPHATSKIGSEEDLLSIDTMGFRGEALASISSVSKLRIVSREAGSVEGHEIRVVADQVESSQAAGRPIGTTVEVRDLFFNVPARRKFLRAQSTEMGHINEQLARIALARPDIAFELSHNGRVAQQLPPCDTPLERIAKFYSPELASALMTIERSERGLDLKAYVAPPDRSRATTQWQYTFVNGRYIRDRYIQHAVREAHRGLMEPNRHGVVFLFLMVDPRSLDVNVHPTKIEVRWADSQLIHSQVLSALRETFQRCDLTPALRTDRAREPVSEAEQERIRREMAATLKATPPIQGRIHDESDAAARPHSAASVMQPRGEPSGPPMNPEQIWRSLYGVPRTEPRSAEPTGPPAAQARGTAPHRTLTDSPTASAGAFPSGNRRDAVLMPPRRAVQMHNLYLVAETEDGIVIVDQHALHERVIYEQLRQRFSRGPLEGQRLLLPETFKVTSQQMALLEVQGELLVRLGIEVSPFGTDSVAVQAFPALLKDTQVVSFMHDLLDRLAQPVGAIHGAGQGGSYPTAAPTPPTDAVIDDLLSMMACKAAVKAGDPLGPEEIDALFAHRDLLEKSSSCPHGRPTMLRLSKADLDRQFHRT